MNKREDKSLDAYFDAEDPKQKLNLTCFDCDKSLQTCTCMNDTINIDTTDDNEGSSDVEFQSERIYSEKEIQHVLDGFTVFTSGEYIKTNFIELLKQHRKQKRRK